MRENIDLFKDNVNMLKEQNQDLQNKINNQESLSDRKMEIEDLFNGLKEDNEKLALELKRLSDENFELQQYLGVSKETIQQ